MSFPYCAGESSRRVFLGGAYCAIHHPNDFLSGWRERRYEVRTTVAFDRVRIRESIQSVTFGELLPLYGGIRYLLYTKNERLTLLPITFGTRKLYKPLIGHFKKINRLINMYSSYPCLVILPSSISFVLQPENFFFNPKFHVGG